MKVLNLTCSASGCERIGASLKIATRAEEARFDTRAELESKLKHNTTNEGIASSSRTLPSHY
ncbi:hypothetical protein CK203_054757 [Vitis vinifera]|uniref:Uncharacterized protein n=1 Tax=Vitis vinifera TaxID=29760 RepID=A0A438GIQ1_VITVI|nr:hypothetical protein CK203_054757 [Vitis vinifera]